MSRAKLADYELRLQAAVNEAGEALKTRDLKVVFAESCTSGLIAASLARTPGISSHLCGSFVTYRNSAKQELLGISEALLAKHTAVSRAVTDQMAVSALSRMPEADLALAITGHLGPDADEGLDGKVFVALANDRDSGEVSQAIALQLTAMDRVSRQIEAAAFALGELAKQIEAS